jgi:hypothetical protein
MSNLHRGHSIDNFYQVLLWKVLSKEFTFCYDPLPNMATTGNPCFWLADLKKSSPLKLLDEMNRNLVWSIYGRSSVKIADHMAATGDSDSWLSMDLDEMSTLYRGPPIDTFYQVSVHLTKRFQKRRIQTWPPQAILVSDWSISKNLLLWNRKAKGSETW